MITRVVHSIYFSMFYFCYVACTLFAICQFEFYTNIWIWIWI